MALSRRTSRATGFFAIQLGHQAIELGRAADLGIIDLQDQVARLDAGGGGAAFGKLDQHARPRA